MDGAPRSRRRALAVRRTTPRFGRRFVVSSFRRIASHRIASVDASERAICFNSSHSWSVDRLVLSPNARASTCLSIVAVRVREPARGFA